ncbi:Protein N-acetyltransferase, RimJ/RimL family [Devosia lucknowensis]|uniref:Protein N-acetyltransferase, RimJ/RimL family n=1 Tax=Devosia lucknowensis TaxID=1096929 RepID=A0A1Y6EVP3_9HYPH|nr:GNAT family N-acetyltransferase [Devosia lucknowensis]SMQ65030.1 Protein N-acetyltransferase, RimJ/RimL family [Devosia lucknowensis]
MIAIPTLTTERLVLRAPSMADYPAYAQFMASDRSRMMGGPHVRWAAWGMFSSDVAMWTLYGHGALMIEARETGHCIGQVGINHGPMFPEKELGWMLYDGFEGRGYATEAGGALKDWAFGTLKLDTLVSYFDPENAKSMAVSARLGGMRDDRATPQDPGDVVFRYFPGR